MGSVYTSVYTRAEKKPESKHSCVFTGVLYILHRKVLDQSRSKTAAIPWPPPMHIVTSAYLPPVRCNS